MKSALRRLIRRAYPFAFLDPEGEEGVRRRGHRAYVGGMWDEIGELQFRFLVDRGMRPSSYLYDIACGSLRLGVKAIPYLEPGHYLGIEKERALVEAGLEQELDPAVRQARRPQVVVSDSFEFGRLGHKADFAIAQSLFTHLPSDLVGRCFSRLQPFLEDDGVFYATFWLTDTRARNPHRPHDHYGFRYTREEMLDFGGANGFTPRYIGDWGHPRGQVIVEYRRAV